MTMFDTYGYIHIPCTCYTYLFIYPFISLASSGIVYQSSAKRRCPMSELFYFWTKFENFKDGISHYNWSPSAIELCIYSMIIINRLIDYKEFFLNIVKSSFLKYFLPLLCYANYFMTQKVINHHSTQCGHKQPARQQTVINFDKWFFLQPPSDGRL